MEESSQPFHGFPPSSQREECSSSGHRSVTVGSLRGPGFVKRRAAEDGTDEHGQLKATTLNYSIRDTLRLVLLQKPLPVNPEDDLVRVGHFEDFLKSIKTVDNLTAGAAIIPMSAWPSLAVSQSLSTCSDVACKIFRGRRPYHGSNNGSAFGHLARPAG